LRKEFSDKSLKMGIFHVKAGTPAAKALPDKTLLKDGARICLDFCSQVKKIQLPAKVKGSLGRRLLAVAGEVTRHGRAHPY
jgi:hypothetical protein